MRNFSSILFLLIFNLAFSQNSENKCNLEKSYFEDILRVDVNDVKCIAKNSEQPNTIYFTFGSWCVPCVYHIPSFFAVEKYYKVDIYVLLVDKEDNHFAEEGRDMVLQAFPNAKILVIKDLEKGGKSKKYKDFLAKITPPQFENIDDMGKYIVLNQKGEVQMVTTSKDSKNDPDWKDDRPMIKRLIIPLLQKKDPIVAK